MGSKRTMLQNGLGKVLLQEISGATRFVDLFAGSGSVAIFVAQKFEIPVLAFDLQEYSVILTAAIISRNAKLDWLPIWKRWLQRATTQYRSHRIPKAEFLTQKLIHDLRIWCDKQTDLPITKAYGGHYFSPRQAVWIDALRATLPKELSSKKVALAALIQAASRCAAAPGHTAQPFQPTRTAKRFIKEAWDLDVVEKTKTAFELLATQSANKVGKAEVADANKAVKKLRSGDLVFLDPPYSGVHYSRFYHVLETIAKGSCGEVTGVGRYPASELRPRSKYSVSSESAKALEDLFKSIALHSATAIVTFPDHVCSNGLSGKLVREIASKYFQIREQLVTSKFSTLGGTGDERGNEAGRSARQHANELILVLTPKARDQILLSLGPATPTPSDTPQRT
ncbi:MAG: DNA adenine methylase [Anaerolineales bacterium]|nr:DNA adenine methylase [Anaerolineales bacterium]